MKFFHKILSTVHNDLKENIINLAIVLSILATVYLISENIFLSFVVAAVCAILLLRWDSRIFFVFGLAFLVFCPVLLAFDLKSTAEEMAVYAYYMLALGVIMQIVHHVRDSMKHGRRVREVKEHSGEYWTKKKLAIWTLGICFLTFAVSATCFYVFYKKIKTEVSKNKEEVIEMTQKNDKNGEAQKTQPAKAKDTRKPEVVEIEDKVGDWETVKVFVINTTQQPDLEKIVSDTFKKIGILNIFPSQTNSTPVQITTVEYCTDCFNVAQELASNLPAPKGVLLTANPTLENKIMVHLGIDQEAILVKE